MCSYLAIPNQRIVCVCVLLLCSPDKWYWIMAIIARKFAIAFTALMFNRNPGFQLSVALLVMFCSYALQVKHTPYMSMSEREEVLRDHFRQSQKVGSVHNYLAQSIAVVMKKGRRGAARMTMDGARQVATRGQAAANFLFNYNTVEATLLASAVLVNLAGVMFESNRFADNECVAAGAGWGVCELGLTVWYVV